MRDIFSRRGFLRSLGAILAFAGLGGVSRWALGGTPTELVPETDAMAKALRYVADAKAASESIRKKKQGVEGKDQTCKNCVQYKPTGEKDGAEVGTCKLIPNGLVPAAGWCGSWAKKA
jgi:hypothetical protein